MSDLLPKEVALYLEGMRLEAQRNGIESAGFIRSTLIGVRNECLTDGNFQWAVMLSHIIWWLSILDVVEINAMLSGAFPE